MIVSTWNVREFMESKAETAPELIRTSDLVLLTETWKNVDDTDDWNAMDCNATMECGN